MNWLADNIVPSWNDNAWSVMSGGATIEAGKIELPVNSSVRLKIEKGNALMGSSYMRFKIKFNGTFSENDDYSPNCALDIKITYLDNTIQTSRMSLNKDVTIDGLYIDDTAFSVASKNISIIEIYFNNYSTALGNLYINTVEIYKSEDIMRDQIANAVSEVVSLKKLTSYDNGCIIEWKGDSQSLKLEFIEDNSAFIGILINDVDFIQYSKIAGTLP